jgi:hypothetical protein
MALTDLVLGELSSEVETALRSSPTRDLIISHASAARLWNLPRPLGGWLQPQFTAASGANLRRRGMQVRVAPLAEADVLKPGAVTITSPARTVADCLRSLPGRDALAMADAALHRGLTTSGAVLDVLHRQSGWPGVGLAREVLKLAHPQRESALESWSAWAFAAAGVPPPQWQVNICGPDGRLIGRVTCWWATGAVVGAAAERARRAPVAVQQGGGEAALDPVRSERRREQQLRAAGAELIRWSAADVLAKPGAANLAGRIRAALSQGQQNSCFSGIAAPDPPRIRPLEDPAGQRPS